MTFPRDNSHDASASADRLLTPGQLMTKYENEAMDEMIAGIKQVGEDLRAKGIDPLTRLPLTATPEERAQAIREQEERGRKSTAEWFAWLDKMEQTYGAKKPRLVK